MGNCFRKQQKSTYNHIDEEGTARDRTDSANERVVVREESGRHHSVKEEEVVIRIGESTQIHSKVIPDDLLGLSDYPFLNERETKTFIANSHTVFIMRGVPGSGKSTLAKRIQKEYPHTVKCSADDFFIDSDGVYKYDHTKIPKAHETCQEKAEESFNNGVSVIVIDNTNTHRWEMSPYIKLAQFTYFYHVIPVEPNTPWKDNVEELHKKTQHGVPADKIKEMLRNLKSQQLRPLYYGWFLTQKDSKALFELGAKCLREGVEAIGDGQLERINLADILNKLQSNYLKPHLMLHCTAKYLGSNPKSEYHHRELVKKAMHKTFKLKVTGFSFTETNIGAKLELDSAELKLFESEYENEMRQNGEDSDDQDIGCSDGSKILEVPHGCSAHVTLTFTHDSSARITGKDMLEIWIRKQSEKYPRNTIKTKSGQFDAWDDGYFFFQLTEPVCYTTLFHGYYPRR